MKPNLALIAFAGVCLCACRTDKYRILQPETGTPVVDKAAVGLQYAPLDYRFSRYHDRLAISVTNPTDDRIVLEGRRSVTIDPHGESHPLRDRVIGPHSFTRLVLPPIAFTSLRFTYAYPNFWNWGPGWGWGPGSGFYGPPSVTEHRVVTPYDWEWMTGRAQLRLVYNRNGKTFEHNFEILREPAGGNPKPELRTPTTLDRSTAPRLH